jgi:hypothetical protein
MLSPPRLFLPFQEKKVKKDVDAVGAVEKGIPEPIPRTIHRPGPRNPSARTANPGEAD